MVFLEGSLLGKGFLEVEGKGFMVEVSSAIRSVPLMEGLDTEKENAEKRERIGWETWLVKMGRMMGRQTLADLIC